MVLANRFANTNMACNGLSCTQKKPVLYHTPAWLAAPPTHKSAAALIHTEASTAFKVALGRITVSTFAGSTL